MGKVLFASMTAGGGHNALRDSLIRATVAADPSGRRVQPVSWNTSSSYNRFYSLCVRLGIQGWVFSFTKLALSTWVSARFAPRMVRECREILLAEQPDIVISTHLVLATAFLIARKQVRSPATLVTAIPDYGPPTEGFFPSNRRLRAEHTLVVGEDTHQILTSRSSVSPGEIHLGGFLTDPAFSSLRAEGESVLEPPTHPQRRRWLAELQAHYPQLARFDLSRPTVAFVGGSAWSVKAEPVLRRLLDRPECAGRFNALVFCGNDAGFLERLGREARPEVFPFGFVNSATLARLLALVDAPVLGSLAAASLHEMTEVGCGPLLIYHLIPGTEPPYAPFVESNGIGLYEPDAGRMTELVLEAIGLKPASERIRRLKADFRLRAHQVRSRSKARAATFVDYLESLPTARPMLGARGGARAA